MKGTMILLCAVLLSLACVCQAGIVVGARDVGPRTATPVTDQARESDLQLQIFGQDSYELTGKIYDFASWSFTPKWIGKSGKVIEDDHFNEKYKIVVGFFGNLYAENYFNEEVRVQMPRGKGVVVTVFNIYRPEWIWVDRANFSFDWTDSRARQMDDEAFSRFVLDFYACEDGQLNCDRRSPIVKAAFSQSFVGRELRPEVVAYLNASIMGQSRGRFGIYRPTRQQYAAKGIVWDDYKGAETDYLVRVDRETGREQAFLVYPDGGFLRVR